MYMAAPLSNIQFNTDYYTQLGDRLASNNWFPLGLGLTISVVMVFLGLGHINKTGDRWYNRYAARSAETGAAIAFPGLFAVVWLVIGWIIGLPSLLGPDVLLPDVPSLFNGWHWLIFVVSLILSLTVLARVGSNNKWWHWIFSLSVALGAFWTLPVIINIATAWHVVRV